MKFKIILLLFLVSVFNGYSQKKYFFDYIIAYKFQKNQTSKVELRYLLTNSKDNTYECAVSVEDDVNFDLGFRDEKGIWSNFIINKSEFFKAETISLSCESVHYQMENTDKYDSGVFDFINKKDTLISDVYYKNYEMKFHNDRKAKKYNHGISHYIIENNSEFHLPLMMFSSVYDYRVSSRDIPNGIAKLIYSLSYDKNEHESIYKLLQFAKTNKFIIVPPECDYTNPKVSKN
ncbi:hypothetical protein [Flavobacterium sp. K5-23]|uniref:hypothetical protein n=1 Tax=Flavobacterium sp. K5-23 TaxID=2746225 RepID=UPI00200BE548|nr:hypothetical protein [Flavobacterium sp. K5-23]UQD57463.1 hypothetical protein FLAK523_14100 [Flavobacterium sp. K5-23]